MKRTLALCLMLAMILVIAPVYSANPTLGTRARTTYTTTATNGVAYNYNMSTLTSGIGMRYLCNTATSHQTGAIFQIYAPYLTTGDALQIVLDNSDLASTGTFINCIGGADADTPVFEVAEDGATSITSTVATTSSMIIKNLGATTGDLLTLTADASFTSGSGNYLQCLGGASGTTEEFAISEDGLTEITSTAVDTNTLTITNLTATTGDLVTLTADDDALDTGGYYLNCLGGTNHATQVFAIAEHGVLTFGDAGTIDGETGTNVINITEDTVRATGALDVTGAATVAGTIGSAALKVPLIAAAVTDYNAQAATLTIAGLRGGFVTQNSQTGASTATTPTGTEISAGITGVATGHSFSVVYYNRGNQTSTITAGASGVTVYGTAAIATLKTAVLYFVCTGSNAWSCYVVAGA